MSDLSPLAGITQHELVDASTSGVNLRQVTGTIITKIQMTHD
jgi:hypothetical protein